MSTLWTPRGEHPIGDEPPETTAPQPPPAAGPDAGELSAEDRERAEAMAKEMAEVQRKVAEQPIEAMVANHAVGLYELAAIHLNQEQPDLAAAQLAIDALGALVEGVAGRLGENEPALRQALQQIRLVFVQLKGSDADSS